MTRVAVAVREGVRLLRSAPLRAAVVAGAIVIGTVLGVLSNELAFPCWALSFVVLVVARRSPRPERVESASVWARVGSGRFWIWLSGGVEALILGVVPALIALCVLAIVRRVSGDTGSLSGGDFAAWQLGALVFAACLPTVRRGRRRRTVARGMAAGLRALVLVFAVITMFRAATTIRTDFDLAIAGLFIILLLTIVGSIAAGPASRVVARAFDRVPRSRAIAAIAARHRTPGTVQLVIVVAVTIATAAAILGASVEARPDVEHVADATLAQVPALPRNVALLRVEPAGFGAFDPNFRPFFTAAQLVSLRRKLTDVVPGAEVIALRDLGVEVSSDVSCPSCTDAPLIVEDPRLRSVYGGDRRYPVPTEPGEQLAGLAAHAATRVRPHFDIYRDALLGGAPPPASFAGAVYYEVPHADAAGHPTRVRGVFLRVSEPLTSSQLHRLAALARASRPIESSRIVFIGATAPNGFAIGVSPTLREASWAATSASSRWSVTLAAGLFALAALLLTLTIDSIDRRRDVRRLERIGATPAQVRGGAALHAAALVVAVTSLSTVLVSALVIAGTRAFNRDEPDIPVPFTMPWLVIAVLVIALPVVAAGLAALVARPVHLGARTD